MPPAFIPISSLSHNHVTIHQEGGASITRSLPLSTLSLVPGNNTLVFTDLSKYLAPKSVRVEIDGRGVDVTEFSLTKLTEVPPPPPPAFSPSTSEDLSKWEDQLRTVELQCSVFRLINSSLREREQRVKDLLIATGPNLLPRAPTGRAQVELQTESLMLSQERERNSQSLRDAEQRLRDLRCANRVHIQQRGRPNRRREDMHPYLLRVSIHCPEGFKTTEPLHAELKVSYAIPRYISWASRYEVSLDSKEKKGSIKSRAYITNATGEIWNDATVSLVTEALVEQVDKPPRAWPEVPRRPLCPSRFASYVPGDTVYSLASEADFIGQEMLNVDSNEKPNRTDEGSKGPSESPMREKPDAITGDDELEDDFLEISEEITCASEPGRDNPDEHVATIDERDERGDMHADPQATRDAQPPLLQPPAEFVYDAITSPRACPPRVYPPAQAYSRPVPVNRIYYQDSAPVLSESDCYTNSCADNEYPTLVSDHHALSLYGRHSQIPFEFTLPYKATLPSTAPNGKYVPESGLNLVMSTHSFSAEISFITVPSGSPTVYRSALIKQSPVDVISGEAQLIFDGRYVGCCVLDETSEGEEMTVNLGQEERVKVVTERVSGEGRRYRYKVSNLVGDKVKGLKLTIRAKGEAGWKVVGSGWSEVEVCTSARRRERHVWEAKVVIPSKGKGEAAVVEMAWKEKEARRE